MNSRAAPLRSATNIAGPERGRSRLTGEAMTRTARASRAGRGFSLFELVLVLVIMALMAGIAIPRFAGANTRYRLEAAERRLLADVDFLGQRARARGVAHEIDFDAANATYTTYAGTGAGREAIGSVDLGASPYRVSMDPPVIDGGGATLTYSGRGRPGAAASVTLWAGETSRVVVLAAADKVEPGAGDDDGVDVLDILDLPGDIIGGLLGGLR